MRVLCLHGHRTSGAILREQMLEVGSYIFRIVRLPRSHSRS